MEKFTLWVKLSSVAAIASAVMLTLIPESKLKNTYKAISGMIVIFLIFSAFTNLDFSEYLHFYKSEEISRSVEEKTDELLDKEGEEIIISFLNERLKNAGFDVKLECVLEGDKIERITVCGLLKEEEKDEIMRVINESVKEVNEVIFALESYEE